MSRLLPARRVTADTAASGLPSVGWLVVIIAAHNEVQVPPVSLAALFGQNRRPVSGSPAFPRPVWPGSRGHRKNPSYALVIVSDCIVRFNN